MSKASKQAGKQQVAPKAAPKAAPVAEAVEVEVPALAAVADDEDDEVQPDMIGDVSFRRATTDKRMTNKQKCLVLGSRSMNAKCRHLLNDLQGLMPHSRQHHKLDTHKDVADQIGGIAELHRCNSVMYLEARKNDTAYMWLAQSPAGPSVKLQLLNVHTASEIRMAGNCLKFSRPLLHFDKEFDQLPQLKLIKSLLVAAFNTPLYHPKSKPFVDHLMGFFFLENRIWFRNYQMQPEQTPFAMSEIGPRFTMDPVTILNGCCRGSVLWRNPLVIAPTELRKTRKMASLKKMQENEKVEKKSQKHKVKNPAPEVSELDEVFK
jgi:ribosome biogenesis protein BRX1